MNRKVILGLSLAFLVIALLGTCSSWSRPSDVTSEQLHVINTQLDTIHEQIVAVDSGGTWLVIVLGACVLAPIVLAVVLLVQADRMALHNDEILRQLDQHGVTSEIIDTSTLLKPRLSVGRIILGHGLLIRVVRGREHEDPKRSTDEPDPAA